MRLPVLLDRDGVINFDSTDFIKTPAELRPIPGSLEAIALWSRAGHPVVVVTNQSGIARGLFTNETLSAIHAKLEEQVVDHGGEIHSILVCPHLPEADCGCRKPRTGLLERAERELGRSLRGALLIGDRCSDIEMARTGGCRPVLVRTGRGRESESRLDPSWGVSVYNDLLSATIALVPQSRE